MSISIINTKIILVLLLLFSFYGFAQSNRSTLNQGVDKYEEKKFNEAEIDFRKVVENSPKSYEANFNLGDAYYKQGKYEDAIKSFQSALESAKDNDRKAKVYHNIGNSLLKNNKIEQSIEAYKNALKFNPDDSDTKYNLSYALELLKNQNKDQQNKNDKDNKDKNKQDQQQQNQNQDQKDNDQNKQDQPQLKDQESKQDNTKQQQPKEEKISKEEAQRILDALKNNEKDLQKQLRKKSGPIKKTDKDW
ncbi:MAG: tetratricopeptide repeat protein [Ignavibacterium sp.]|nr:tetratricopeptide repeat protein [Ignavibacterium sp.]